MGKSTITTSDPHPGVRHLVIDRPEKKNALDAATYRALTSALRDADADDSVRAIVLSGAGDNFSSGNDLADFLAAGTPDAEPAVGLLKTLVLCDTPLVASVEGFAIGIGATILLHCDLAVSGRSASFAMPFVALGLSPEGGSSYILPRIAGSKLANELLLLGERFDADTASRAGLLNRVVDDGEAVSTAIDLAVRLAQQPREALRAARRLLGGDRERILAVIDAEVEVFLKRLASDETRRILQSQATRAR